VSTRRFRTSRLRVLFRKLAISQQGKHRQGMPVGGGKRSKSPGDVFPGQAGLNIGIARDVEVVVQVYKLIIDDGIIDHERQEDEKSVQ